MENLRNDALATKIYVQATVSFIYFISTLYQKIYVS
jgi:hypothetical protein